MIQNKNEQYLLKYLSGFSSVENQGNDLISLLVENNIPIDFKNTNPIYQIIDEINFSTLLEAQKSKE